MSSFDQPFRGLPAEIRMMIWDYSVPTVVRALNAVDQPGHNIGRNQQNLESSGVLPVSLLLVSKQVYVEALPFMRAAEVRLEMLPHHEVNWPKLERDLQSPAFGALHYSLKTGGSSFGNSFLYKFMALKILRPLRLLIISLEGTTADLMSVSSGEGELRSRSLYIEARHAMTVFASVYLSKGLVSEVQVRMTKVPEFAQQHQVSEWEPAKLQAFLLDPTIIDSSSGMPTSERQHRYNNDHVLFHSIMVGSLTPEMRRSIQIATGTWQQRPPHHYSGSVTYKLADQSLANKEAPQNAGSNH